MGKHSSAAAAVAWSTPQSETKSLSAVDTVAPTTLSSSLDPSVAPWYAAPLHYDPDAVVPHPFLRPRAGTDTDLSIKASRFSFRTKGRSKSSPAPFSALDVVPVAQSDIFRPLPLLRRNYIEQILPRELQIHIFQCFIQSFEDDHANAVAEGRWTISKAVSSRHRFVGSDRGIRELFKLAIVSRATTWHPLALFTQIQVSRLWRSLVYDGQLWTILDLHSFPGLPKSVILRLARSAGPFLRGLDFMGHCNLQAGTLTDISKYLCSKHISHSLLTAINLQGCSTLTTNSLNDLLVRCISLRRLCLKGLSAVTNTTCEALGAFCPQLERLNLDRCSGMDAKGLCCLFNTLLMLQGSSCLKELRVSGLKDIDDATMRLLGKAAPHLEILDLSHARQLHDSALEAFIAVNDTLGSARPSSEVVRLNALQTGRAYVNEGYHLRRVTKLRHLSLSSCIMLTDTACSNLAYAVPRLEYFEMAGIGADLKDDGLIRLLNTTPHIRRLDLEYAIDLTDSVLSAITPHIESADQKPDSSLPCHALEWLVVSHAGNLSDEALFAVIHACPKLRVLEADDTKLSGSTLKEFVRLSRERRAHDARVVAIDCRGVVEGVVKELGSKGTLRPRLGVRAFWARRLGYVDGKDEMCEEDLKIGYDECDPKKVIVKTFYSWQSVDAVRSAREKRKKTTSRRAGNISPDFPDDIFDSDFVGGAERPSSLTRWWSPNGRSSNGRNSPAIIPDLNNDGCIIM